MNNVVIFKVNCNATEVIEQNLKKNICKKSEFSPMKQSSGVRFSPMLIIIGTIICLIWLKTLLCVSITPLGFPVDPLVYIIMATSSPLIFISAK